MTTVSSLEVAASEGTRSPESLVGLHANNRSPNPRKYFPSRNSLHDSSRGLGYSAWAQSARYVRGSRQQDCSNHRDAPQGRGQGSERLGDRERRRQQKVTATTDDDKDEIRGSVRSYLIEGSKLRTEVERSSMSETLFAPDATC